MTSSLRSVFDTNTIVSALLLPDSKPREALDRAQGRGKILISMPTLLELSEVIARKKFDKYLSEEQRKEFLAALVTQAELLGVTEKITDCRDPKDNKFLELAVCGSADCNVSGEGDLLVLHPFRGILILQPGEFLKQF
ncbi:MAG TPA: putative toxin-antitoxin system toxin component, PIN family [Blastocatellia bacterium]|nr:putative toxin-antitoxin system toxin component, PIN family [Blastocatellia bacterium]